MRHRLTFVTGKGGVGKSTVSAALAIASAEGGARTLLAQVSGGNHMQRAFGRDGCGREEVELAQGLFTTSIDPELAMAEYLRIRMGALGRVIGSANLVQALTMATPGMREMQTMAKIWELAHPRRPAGTGLPYDVVVVDAPSTGHSIGMLRTPRTFAELARVGPVAQGARRIAAMIADPAFTGVVGVTTADEMAVTELLALQDALAADGLHLSSVVRNRLGPDRFTPDEVAELQGRLADASGGVQDALRAAVFEHQRAALESDQLRRLAEVAAGLQVDLPFLVVGEWGQAALHALADVLAEAWPAHVAERQP